MVMVSVFKPGRNRGLPAGTEKACNHSHWPPCASICCPFKHSLPWSSIDQSPETETADKSEPDKIEGQAEGVRVRPIAASVGIDGAASGIGAVRHPTRPVGVAAKCEAGETEGRSDRSHPRWEGHAS